MYATPSSRHELVEISAVELRRTQCIKAADARLAKAEKRFAATEAQISACQREHDETTAEEVAKLNLEIEKIRARTRRQLSNIQGRQEAAREKRETIEAQTKQLLADTEAIRSSSKQLRERIEEERASANQNTEVAIRSANEDVHVLSAAVGDEVHAILGSVSAENSRVWALEDHMSFARDLTGVKTLDAPDPLPSKAVLPFGECQNPFDGYGTYGMKPPQGPPRGFMEQTRRILDAGRSG